MSKKIKLKMYLSAMFFYYLTFFFGSGYINALGANLQNNINTTNGMTIKILQDSISDAKILNGNYYIFFGLLFVPLFVSISSFLFLVLGERRKMGFFSLKREKGTRSYVSRIMWLIIFSLILCISLIIILNESLVNKIIQNSSDTFYRVILSIGLILFPLAGLTVTYISSNFQIYPKTEMLALIRNDVELPIILFLNNDRYQSVEAQKLLDKKFLCVNEKEMVALTHHSLIYDYMFERNRTFITCYEDYKLKEQLHKSSRKQLNTWSHRNLKYIMVEVNENNYDEVISKVGYYRRIPSCKIILFCDKELQVNLIPREGKIIIIRDKLSFNQILKHQLNGNNRLFLCCLVNYEYLDKFVKHYSEIPNEFRFLLDKAIDSFGSIEGTLVAFDTIDYIIRTIYYYTESYLNSYDTYINSKSITLNVMYLRFLENLSRMQNHFLLKENVKKKVKMNWLDQFIDFLEADLSIVVEYGQITSIDKIINLIQKVRNKTKGHGIITNENCFIINNFLMHCLIVMIDVLRIDMFEECVESSFYLRYNNNSFINMSPFMVDIHSSIYLLQYKRKKNVVYLDYITSESVRLRFRELDLGEINSTVELNTETVELESDSDEKRFNALLSNMIEENHYSMFKFYWDDKLIERDVDKSDYYFNKIERFSELSYEEFKVVLEYVENNGDVESFANKLLEKSDWSDKIMLKCIDKLIYKREYLCAKSLLYRCFKNNDPVSFFREGIILMMKEDYNEGEKLLKKSYDLGNREHLIYLAWLHLSNKLLSPDRNFGIKMLNESLTNLDLADEITHYYWFAGQMLKDKKKAKRCFEVSVYNQSKVAVNYLKNNSESICDNYFFKRSWNREQEYNDEYYKNINTLSIGTLEDDYIRWIWKKNTGFLIDWSGSE